MEKETIERDYEEFKAPDTNNDDMISRSEFNTYVRKYLSSFPELSEKDFPKFEEFDLDGFVVVVVVVVVFDALFAFVVVIFIIVVVLLLLWCCYLSCYYYYCCSH